MNSHKKTVINKALQIIDGGMSKIELEFLYDLCADKSVLELGSMVGMSSYVIASIAKEIDCVDAWDNTFLHLQHDPLQMSVYDKDWIKKFNNTPPDMLEIFKHNCKEYIDSGKLKIRKGTTSDVCASIEDDKYDIVFIDADHSYEGVKQDISNYLSKIKSNGLMIFHDYNDSWWPGVEQAVTEALRDNIITIYSDNLNEWLIGRVAVFKKSK
jgi:predicted O-methyltransferase YrrM